MGIKHAWRKIKSAAKGLFRPPVGFPLGVHVPADPADHADDFAHRDAEPLDWLAAIRMDELGIPSDRIGSSDHRHGLAGRAFNPYERDGGGISPGGRIILDSGSFNPDQITKQYGKWAGKLWAKSRPRDRWDALVAHEDAEWRMGGDHDVAVRVAPETELPISDRARQILVEMRRGWRGRQLAAWLEYGLYPDVITVTPSCKAVVVLSHHIGPSTVVLAAAFPHPIALPPSRNRSVQTAAPIQAA